MDMMELIRPEMLTLIPVLYLIGVALKKVYPAGAGTIGSAAGCGVAAGISGCGVQRNAKPADGSGAGDSLRWVQRLCKPDLQTAE